MTTIVDQPPPIVTNRRPAWDLVIEQVELRRPALGFVGVVDRVILDMRERDAIGRERYGTALTSGNGRDHLVDAYQEALDFAAYMAAALDEHGIPLDEPIDVRMLNSAALIHVQAMLWEHIRTIVQLRSIIEGFSHASIPTIAREADLEETP